MHSLVSLQLGEDHGALLSAVTDVAENSLFTFADPSDEAAFEAAAPGADAHGGWLRACVTFAGPIGGRFELTAPRALALRLCAAFAGAEPSEDISDGDLTDFVGELANMMCGAWLTRTCRHASFDLSEPQVLRGRPHRCVSAPPVDRLARRVYFSVDDTPIRLDIDWATSDRSGLGGDGGR